MRGQDIVRSPACHTSSLWSHGCGSNQRRSTYRERITNEYAAQTAWPAQFSDSGRMRISLALYWRSVRVVEEFVRSGREDTYPGHRGMPISNNPRYMPLGGRWEGCDSHAQCRMTYQGCRAAQRNRRNHPRGEASSPILTSGRSPTSSRS